MHYGVGTHATVLGGPLIAIHADRGKFMKDVDGHPCDRTFTLWALEATSKIRDGIATGQYLGHQSPEKASYLPINRS